MGFIPSDPSSSPVSPQGGFPHGPQESEQTKSFELPEGKLPLPSQDEIKKMDLDTFKSRLIAYCKEYQKTQSPESKNAALQMVESFNMTAGAIHNRVGPERQFEIKDSLQEFFSQCSIEKNEGKQSQEVAQNLTRFEQKDFSRFINSVNQIFNQIEKNPRFYR